MIKFSINFKTVSEPGKKINPAALVDTHKITWLLTLLSLAGGPVYPGVYFASDVPAPFAAVTRGFWRLPGQ